MNILPELSNYERLIYDQINQMTENVLSIFQCGFRKKYSTQHALIAKIEKTRKIPNKDGTFGALLTDLSKAFIVWHTTLEQNSMHWTLIMNAFNLIFD